MLFNIILVFVIPWVVAILHLYKRDTLLIILISPFFSVVAFTINEFGFYFGFWAVKPFLTPNTISSLPFNLGVYPVLAGYLIFFIKRYKYPYVVILLMTAFTTILEIIFVSFERVIYNNGWNSTFTFFSYLFPYMLTYWYYKRINRFFN